MPRRRGRAPSARLVHRNVVVQPPPTPCVSNPGMTTVCGVQGHRGLTIMDWTQEAIERLQALWAEGHSTAEIGRRMGISKNAVVGKAHRLNLSARPSPIRRDSQPRVERPRVPRATPRRDVMRMPSPAAPVQRQAAPTPAVPKAVAAPTLVRSSFQRSGQRNCCWPLGEPGSPDFRFCSAEGLAGKPYCAAHAAVAYVKARDRREDAA